MPSATLSAGRESAVIEPRMVALYEAALDELAIGEGDRVLDLGRETSLFLRLAGQRGATAVGARAAVPLPFAAGSFDIVTGFDASRLAADPVVREAGRVGRRVLLATWGRPDQCEAAAYVRLLGADPFALSEPGALAAVAARGGLVPGERREVACVWSFPDAATLLRGVTADSMTRAILAAVAPYRTSDGGYRLENVFHYLIAHT